MENKEEKKEMNWQEIALSLAKDLVQLAQLSKSVVETASVPTAMIEQTRLLISMNEDILATYVEINTEEEVNEQEG
jgi:hypothetical protein